MKRIILTKDDCYKGILSFYEHVAKEAGCIITEDTNYDCRKICVTEPVQDEIVAFHKHWGATDLGIASMLAQVGPKATVTTDKAHPYIAEVEDDFAY